MLELEDVHTYYGSIHALKGVSLRVYPGEIVTLIGGNGAGKTTTLNTICGILRPRQGRIRFRGEEITGLPPHAIVRRGVAQTPEGRKIFSRLTVLENLCLGAFARDDRLATAQDLERVFTLFPRLAERRSQLGGTLSGGEQQMLAIGRALMARPDLLLLDEPSMGLAPLLVRQVFQVIQEIHRQGTTVLLVEQNAHMALRISRRGYVLQSGGVIAQATSEELRKNPIVRRAYLGEVEEAS
ncbi:MAG TPA: ABC transporter ATP-binding protein [Chloroflexota bacterium]